MHGRLHWPRHDCGCKVGPVPGSENETAGCDCIRRVSHCRYATRSEATIDSPLGSVQTAKESASPAMLEFVVQGLRHSFPQCGWLFRFVTCRAGLRATWTLEAGRLPPTLDGAIRGVRDPVPESRNITCARIGIERLWFGQRRTNGKCVTAAEGF